MITLFIAQGEDKIKDTLMKLLQSEGYSVSDASGKARGGGLYKVFLEKYEKPLIEDVLEQTKGNQLKAAKILGINRNTMRSKIKKFNINLSKI